MINHGRRCRGQMSLSPHHDRCSHCCQCGMTWVSWLRICGFLLKPPPSLFLSKQQAIIFIENAPFSYGVASARNEHLNWSAITTHRHCFLSEIISDFPKRRACLAFMLHHVLALRRIRSPKALTTDELSWGWHPDVVLGHSTWGGCAAPRVCM